MNLESMMKENPEALVVTVDGIEVTDSLQVASNFGKQHYHVLRSIKNLVKEINAKEDPISDEDWMYGVVSGECPAITDRWGQSKNGLASKYFIPATYEDQQGKERKHYWLTRDGFSLLVMGFTGPAALHWKLLYIEAFNKMEAALKAQPMDMEAVIAGVTDRVARKLIPAIFEQLEGRITLPTAVEPQEPVSQEDNGREHNSRRLDFLYGNEEALPNFLTVYDLRDFLGIGQRQAYELIRADGFPKKKLGNAYRIPKKDFLVWLEKQ